MATLHTVKLTKGDSLNWGFRLHGGKDFGTPLVIQKVIVGSPAERAGLLAGDSVIRVQQTDVFNLRHKDAQDVLLRAGNSFDMTIQRGGSTWKPSVVPTEIFSNPSPTINISPVTRTSLAAKPSENIGAIGTGHNVSAKPFANGTLNGGPKVVNNQYNTPLKLYSEESIAETLSAQTEVLSTGALGVNFKKNEKNYDASKSAVLSLLKEEENSTKSSDYTEHHNQTAGLDAAHSPAAVPGIRPVAAPENKPHSPNSQLPPGQNICADCERLIVGVFVRIKDKNLHVECFKCSTCGTSLKNVGYYNINNKLYCDIHAKLAARNNPIAPNLVPITVSPGSRAPADSISAALATHPLPAPAPPSPKINIYQSPLSGPKAFARVPGPLSPANNYNTLPRIGASLPSVAPISSPHSPTATTGSFSTKPTHQTGNLFKVFSPCNIVWPPVSEEPELPTACPLFYPPPSQVTIKPRTRLDSIDSHSSELEKINYMEEYSYAEHDAYSSCETKSTTECAQMLTESVERQMLVENVLKCKPLLQESPKISPRKETQEKNFDGEKTTDVIMEKEYETEISSQTQSHISSKINNPTPQQWESQMLQALKISPNEGCMLDSAECSVETEKIGSDLKTTSSSISDIPIKKPITALGSALAVAPTEPFNPTKSSNTEVIPLPEETVPYFPPENLFAISLTNPVDLNKDKLFKKKIDQNLERILEDLPKPQEKLTMRSALTTASDRPFTPSVFSSDDTLSSSPTPMFKASVQTTPIVFEKLPTEVRTICKEDTKKETNEESQIKTTKTVHKKINEMRPQTLPVLVNIENQGDVTPSPESLPLFQGFTCSFTNKSDVSQFDIQISTTPPIRDKKQRKAPTVSIEEKSQGDLKITEMTEKITTTSTSSKKETQSSEKKEIQKSKETVGNIVYRKPSQMVVLHKSDSLPPYQVSMRETAEADLIMMAKMEKSKQKKKQQELQSEKTKRIDSSPGSVSQTAESNSKQQIEESDSKKILCPIIKVENGIIKHENSFNIVPTGHSLISSSRPLTPSLINRPPPIIPQYQANLVAQKYGPPTVNLLNPQSPAISRSPSPCHKISETSVERSCSLRPKSPAQGPPPNPLQKDHIPTRHDFKLDEAHENLQTYISHYKEETDLCAQQMKTDAKIKENITYTTDVAVEESLPVITCQTQSILEDTSATSDKEQHELGTTQSKDIRKNETNPHSPDKIKTVMDVFENVTSEETLSKMENQYTEKSDCGIFHLEKSKRVFEEFEHSQKTKEIFIERSVKSANQEGFRNVREWENSAQNITGLHITTPNPIKSRFLEFNQEETPPKMITTCQKVGKDTLPKKKECEKPPEKSTLSFPKFDATTLSKPTPFPEIPTAEIPKKDILPRPTKHVDPPGSSKSNQKLTPIVPPYDVGTTGGRQAGAVGISPKRGRGILNSAQLGGRIPLCGHCHGQIRGPFITALGKIWCPNHFVCSTPSCKRPLQDLGFVEEHGQLYCEYCFEQYLAPPCSKCGSKIKGDCLKAIGKAFHPECFNCVHCGVLFGNSPFFLEDGSPYCETDWNAFFTTKCFACGFPVEAGDRWVEALNNNYHSQCFNCTMCKKNLEGQSFFAKGGRPYCKSHAR